MPSESHFATRLVHHRCTLGLTQHQLAQRSGLTQGEISYLEAGKRQPVLPTLLALCEALHCTLDQLCQDVSNPVMNGGACNCEGVS